MLNTITKVHDYDKLLSTIKDNANKRRDAIVPFNKIYLSKKDTVKINYQPYEVTQNFHHNLALQCGIPFKYYKKMYIEDEQLLLRNVNRWIKNDDSDKNVLVRAYTDPSTAWRFYADNNIARGITSSSYRIIDTNELLPLIARSKRKGYELISAHISDRLTNIKVKIPSLYANISTRPKVDDIVFGGFSLRNSELGYSSVTVQALLFRLVCTNGMVLPDTVTLGKAYHIEGEKELGTILDYKIDKKVTDKLNDVIAEISKSKNKFNTITDKLKSIRTDNLERAEVIKVSNKFSDTYHTSSFEEGLINKELMESNDKTWFGLVQAITASAKHISDPIRSLQLERIGGKVFSLKNAELAKPLVAVGVY